MPSDDSDILFPSAQDSDGFEFDSDDAQFVGEDDGELKPLLGDDYYMRAALRCAQQAADAGEVPVGAVAVKDGMIVSVNGIDNPADFSSCWMLYTSDPENSNSAWGTVEYNKVEYGSAVSGAEALKIKPDHIYIWVYQSFS